MTVFTRLPHFLVSVCALALAACAGDDATTEPAAPGADGGILACVGPTATELAAALALPATVECPICEGSLPPSVAMEDVNPASCAAGQTYTVGACEGRPTVVALLAAWCAFCQSQALRMEEIRAEFEQQGIEVNLPKTSSAGVELNDEPLVLVIGADQKMTIAKNRLGMDQLRSKVRAISETKKNKQIYIQADREVTYGFVAEAMAEVRAAGIYNISLITLPKEQ